MKEIVVIEDDGAIAGLLEDLLTDAGYAVRTAPNGREGLALLAQALPNLILCDMMMPILDGRAVCRQLQVTPRYRSIPLVIMSAGATQVSECLVQAFLIKPFDVQAVLSLVHRLIGPPN